MTGEGGALPLPSRAALWDFSASDTIKRGILFDADSASLRPGSSVNKSSQSSTLCVFRREEGSEWVSSHPPPPTEYPMRYRALVNAASQFDLMSIRASI